MARPPADDDGALTRWLAGDRLAVLDRILGEAVDIVGVVDRDLKLRYLNYAAAGLSRDDLVGQNVLTLVPPDQQRDSQDVYEKVLATGVGATFVTVYNAPEGITLWEVRVGPIRADSRVIGLVVIATDVTEQRRALADRERFFFLSLDMLVVLSPGGHLKRINPSFGETLGYDPGELVGKPYMTWVHPDDRESTQKAFDTVLAGEPIGDFENRYRHKDGRFRVFSWRGTVDPVTGDVYAVARDVTEHRRTETQLRQAQKMEAIGLLAGGIAHDFNNLLLAILGNAELARLDLPAGSDLSQHLVDIEASAHRAADLTKQLLMFSRRQPLRPVAVDLNQLINGLMRMLRRLLPESISIDSIPGHDLASVSADVGRLEQVIVNLCVNARDAMGHGGRLTIRTDNVLIDGGYCETHPWARPGLFVLLEVTDTGVGMTPEVRERAFEPFFTTKGQQGTGLGLATVYGIVQQHGGLIHVRSEPGQGTTFKIYLPAGAGAGGAEAVGDELEGLPPRGNETILLAEDEAQVRRAVVQMLQRAGYRTIAVANGNEAVRVLRNTKEVVHLALLDVVMPGLGGPQAWERMRELRPNLRVLFASGYADQQYREQLSPDAEVLEKPFRMDELLRRVRNKLDQGR